MKPAEEYDLNISQNVITNTFGQAITTIIISCKTGHHT